MTVAITLDLDWAPDFAIDLAAGLLRDAGVAATWFVTHRSPAVDRLREHGDLFELGIHPNFLARSTHGTDPDAVIEHCLELVPDATSVRTHGLSQSTALLARLAEHGLTTDVSLFLPRAPWVRPLEHWWAGTMLLRVPYVWEDDYEFDHPEPLWRIEPLEPAERLVVLDFHPVHVFLNSADAGPYRALKDRSPALTSVGEADAARLAHRGPGTRTMFEDAIRAAAREGGGRRIRDLHADAVGAGSEGRRR